MTSRLLRKSFFDTNILIQLNKNDARVTFVYNQLSLINKELRVYNSALILKRGKPIEVISDILSEYNVARIYANEDYEPYGIYRDEQINKLCRSRGVDFFLYKDHVIFAKNEVSKDDGSPYTVFTPYKKKWIKKISAIKIPENKNYRINYLQVHFKFPSLISIGFKESSIQVRDFELSRISNYHLYRDLPYKQATSLLGPHLRFGTVSIRNLVNKALNANEVFLSELIWREFFMQILFHFPSSSNTNFKSIYNFVNWRNKTSEYDMWCQGKTGYPIVDAGMRELNQTGYMHNRVRMIAASFLCKHLLIDWRWGADYFASKLLDYELSSNVGNWQWAASTGCDAVPYFRIFNPIRQQEKFDPEFEYVKKWVSEFGTRKYPKQMVDHTFARERAITVYKKGIRK